MGRGTVLVLGKSMNVGVCVCGECGVCAAPVIFASASPRGLCNVAVCACVWCES